MRQREVGTEPRLAQTQAWAVGGRGEMFNQGVSDRGRGFGWGLYLVWEEGLKFRVVDSGKKRLGRGTKSGRGSVTLANSNTLNNSNCSESFANSQRRNSCIFSVGWQTLPKSGQATQSQTKKPSSHSKQNLKEQTIHPGGWEINIIRQSDVFSQLAPYMERENAVMLQVVRVELSAQDAGTHWTCSCFGSRQAIAHTLQHNMPKATLKLHCVLL